MYVYIYICIQQLYGDCMGALRGFMGSFLGIKDPKIRGLRMLTGWLCFVPPQGMASWTAGLCRVSWLMMCVVLNFGAPD